MMKRVHSQDDASTPTKNETPLLTPMGHPATPVGIATPTASSSPVGVLSQGKDTGNRPHKIHKHGNKIMEVWRSFTNSGTSSLDPTPYGVVMETIGFLGC
jgi:hypothetical protein